MQTYMNRPGSTSQMVDPHHAATFVPYPFRPFWQPNSRASPPSPLHQDIIQLELKRLTQRLDIAERKTDEYARLIASLSAELRRYQDIICHTCREHIIRATLATPAPPTSLTPSAAQLISHSSRINAPSLGFHDQSPEINCLARIHSPARVNNLGRSIAASFSSGNPQVQTIPYLPTPPTSTIPPDFAVANSEPSQPVVPYVSTDAGPSQPKLHQFDWSVEYNPKIKRSLSLRVAKTFTYTTRVCCVKFSRDGKFLAIGLKNGETHIHNMMTGSKNVLAERSATVFYTDAAQAPPRIWCVAFSLDNKCIATGGGQGQINIWDIGRRRICATFKHKKQVRFLDFSPNGRFLVSASCDDSVCLWNIRDGSRIASWHSSLDFTSVAFSPDGRYAAAGNDDGFLWVWNIRTSRLVAKCNIGNRDHLSSSCVIFTPDGKVITSGDNTLKCWDTNSLTRRHSERHMIKMNQDWEFNWLTESITNVSLSPDTRWIVSSSLDDRDNVCILDARSGGWLCTLNAHMSRVRGVDFSPAGHYLVSGGEDRRSGFGGTRWWSRFLFRNHLRRSESVVLGYTLAARR